MSEREPHPATWREHLHAVLLALLCAVAFLRGGLLPGRTLVPFAPQLHDVLRLEAEARGTLDRAAIATGAVGMGDEYFQSLCWRRVLHDRLTAGELPRWTRAIGGGAPFAPQMAQPYHPASLLLAALPAEAWLGWSFLLHQVVIGWTAWLFFRRVGCRHAAALFGIVPATLGLWLQGHLHHDVLVSAALPVWAMLLAAHRLTTPNAPDRARSAAWLALATALSWLAGFAPVSLQATGICLAFAALRTPALAAVERRAAWRAAALAMLAAAAISAIATVPILQAWAESARRARFDETALAAVGLDFADLASLAWPDLLNLPIDRIYPAPPGSSAGDWFVRQPWSQFVLLHQPVHPDDGSSPHVWVETSYSVGLVAVLCALLAWGRRRHRALAWGALLLFAVAFGFATAAPPFLAASRYLPGLQAGDLRRCLFTASVALTTLATLGADALLERRRAWPLRSGALLVGVASAALLAWLWRHPPPDDFLAAMVRHYGGGDDPALLAQVRALAAPGEAEHNHAALLRTLLRALVVAAAVAVATWLPAARRLAWLWPLAALELLHAGLGAVRTAAAEAVRQPPAVLQPLLAAAAPAGVRPRLARLMPRRSRLDQGLPGNYVGWFGGEDTGFYSALAPLRALEFFTAIEPDAADKTDIAYRTAGVGALHDPASLDHPLLDLVGVNFVLTPLSLPPAATRIDRTPPGCGAYHLYERTTVLPRATFVRGVERLPDRAERLAALARRDREPAAVVVLEDAAAPVPAAGAGSGQVTVVDHRDERVALRVTATADGYVRLADPWDPGWRATVDGEAAPIRIADHWLRAVYVTAGEHDVVFTYDAPGTRWPAWLTATALAVTLVPLLRRRRPA